LTRQERHAEMWRQESALAWLVLNDPEAADFWRVRYLLGADLVEAVRENLRDFGPDDEGARIVAGGGA